MKLAVGTLHVRRTVRHGGSLPCIFDPVEQRKLRTPLEDYERVREAIYQWMDCEAGTVEEQSAWRQFRRACEVWLGQSKK